MSFNGPGTDFESLMRPSAPDPPDPQKPKKEPDTSFQALKASLTDEPRGYQPRTNTDLLIDAVIPALILLMVWSLVFFLLDVRFIFDETNDQSLRMFGFSLILGVVGINRLLATDGSEEPLLYIGLFGVVTFLGSLVLTSGYDTGPIGGISGYRLNAWGATFFNLTLVGFLWWMTNRLMHECCIDENRSAGDIGILTGTLRNFRAAVKHDAGAQVVREKRKKQQDRIFEMNEMEAFDPMEWKPPDPQASSFAPPAQRLAKRHPGISIFYFSVPVLAIFALGLPVLMQGGPAWVRTGHVYVALVTFAALSLLLLTSLGGLREYFRSRRVHFPPGIVYFWLGLGGVMIFMVMFGAVALPLPGMPPMAQITEHKYDYFSRDTTFRLMSPAAAAAEAVEQSNIIETVGRVVLVVFAVFLAYAALRGIGGIAALIGRNRDLFPTFVIRFFQRLDAWLERVLKLPALPGFTRTPRISPEIATSVRHHSPLSGEGDDTRANLEYKIAASYEALCALALDLGVPRRPGQTPYEFIQAFPKALKPIEEEAYELTHLYVRAAYSTEPLDDHTLDRLRKFWIRYERLRNKIVR